ncbi:hypothetical protein LCGC14_0918830 [marine sediment metagenome]|uniref:Amidohydrolase-related domain-containing protein n=1 Tax=marine sediment metagenome TaxID=412755 RepID=A0A0F9PC33_9ZZZZ
MIKTAIISPLHQLERYSSLSDTQMCLAQYWDSEPVYRKYFRDMKKRGDCIIMDNGAYELGQSIDIDSYIKAILELEPSIAIVPDVIMNGEETVALANDFLERFPDLPKWTSLMAVPQGSTHEKWTDCLHRLQTLGDFLWWGLPKVCHLVSPGGRLRAYQTLIDSIPSREREILNVHLLGIWLDPIREAQDFLNIPQVKSVDTALPVTLGHLARTLEEFQPHPSGTDFHVIEDVFPDWTLEQVQRFITLCKNEEVPASAQM